MNQIVSNVVEWTKKNSPKILVALGIGSVVIGTVDACKKTTKINSILEEHEDTLKEIKMAADTGVIVDKESSTGVPFTEKDKRKAVARCYGHTVFELGKLYWRPVLEIGGGIGCILYSHNILETRNASLSAAVTTTASMFDQYRKNIIEKFGEEADTEARYSIKSEKSKGKKGEEDKVEYKATEKTGKGIDFSVFYDSTVRGWDSDPSYNLLTLNNAQKELNWKLAHSYDHTITIADCYNMTHTKPMSKEAEKAAKVMGWRFRPGIDLVDENGIPGKIKFGIYNVGQRSNGTVADIPTATYEANNIPGNVDSTLLIDFLGAEPLL